MEEPTELLPLAHAEVAVVVVDDREEERREDEGGKDEIEVVGAETKEEAEELTLPPLPSGGSVLAGMVARVPRV